MVHHAGEPPLATLRQLLKQTIQSEINSVHILPFYPYSSDDGFSVIDFYAVNPELGDWADVQALGQDFHLMFDAVFNHISVKSAWFQAYLRQEPPYDEYFINVDPKTDLSQVRRPRALPLLTRVETAKGERHVWTTFSDDQIDLNVANPDVLLDLIRVLLFYVEQGAALIRLDAIAFLWKEVGTSCVHLPQTHLIIQLMRDILDAVAPEVVIITETNVP
ncbi:MAG: sugar phosphorylase, partial [Anaerolineae bacterium]|nr:sugar phosphorylase [Anaerolineae bacterium]